MASFAPLLLLVVQLVVVLRLSATTAVSADWPGPELAAIFSEAGVRYADVEKELEAWAQSLVAPMHAAGFEGLAQWPLKDELGWQYGGGRDVWQGGNKVSHSPRVLWRFHHGRAVVNRSNALETRRDESRAIGLAAETNRAVNASPTHPGLRLKADDIRAIGRISEFSSWRSRHRKQSLTCDLSKLDVSVQDVDRICCGADSAQSGYRRLQAADIPCSDVPDSCDRDCAAVFEPFFGSCREYLAASLSSALMDSLSGLYTKCGSAAVTPAAAAEQFAAVKAAAMQAPSATSMVSVASQINFVTAIEISNDLTIAETTPARAEFEAGFKLSMASSLGDGATIRQDEVHIDEVRAMEAAMFGGGPPPPLDLLAPLLSPTVGVYFHITVPDGLQATTRSLMETLQASRQRMEVAIGGETVVAETASLVAPIWISMGAQCHYSAGHVPPLRLLVAGGASAPPPSSVFPSALATAEIYDSASNSWSSAPSLGTARYGHAMAAVTGRVYVMGGYDGSSELSSAETYDTLADSWSAIASMTMARHAAAGAAVGGKVYMVGGLFGSRFPTPSAEVYEPSSNSWSAIASMEIARYSHTAVAVGRNIYVMGGSSGDAKSSAEVYSVVSDSWSTISTPWSNGGVGKYNHAAAAIDTMIYVVGGNEPSTVYVYDTVNDEWRSVADMDATMDAGGRNSRPAAVAIGSSLFVMGGQSHAYFLDSAEVYDSAAPCATAWAGVAPMGTARRDTAGAAILPT